MSEDESPGLLDRLVAWVARFLTRIGFNGSRLEWRWHRKRRQIQEAGVRTEVASRAARGRHKMCPECRALVPRSSSRCSECGAGLAGVSTPGVGRMLSNLFPGASTATSLILLVNGFWFLMLLLAQVKAGSGGGGGLFGGFGGELLVRFGSGLSRPVELSGGEIAGGEWWRLITPIFLHGGLMHFFFNSYVLLQLGPVVEQIYGTERFWVIYLGCGILGSAASQLPRFVNTVGASGAIMGLMGLLLVFGFRHGGALGQTLKSSMIRFGVYILIFSLVFPGIDHLNHAGGFAGGALFALAVPTVPQRGRSGSLVWQLLGVGGILLVLWSFYKVAALPNGG